MKVIYVAMEYDYGCPERGKSFEEANFYDSLKHMDLHIIRFDFMANHQKYGQEKMNVMLKEIVFDERPDLVFCVLFKDEIDKSVMKEITEKSNAVTLNWFCDDHWRFANFSKYWAPCFTWVTTTDAKSLEKYRKNGFKNVILTQWACNHFTYKKYDLAKRYDVSFVGQPHGSRKKVIKKLLQKGIKVETWGYGWERGRIELAKMIQIFNTSKINLNLSNSYTNIFRFWEKRREQIKGRNFEIQGCGGFQLSSYVDDIESYFKLDQEIVCFRDENELVEKILFYLEHDKERIAIAKAGYRRVLKEHTYELRFKKIFNHVFAC